MADPVVPPLSSSSALPPLPPLPPLSPSSPPPPLPPARRRSQRQTERLALLDALERLDWRLLSWLLRYPWQRADDLVVGVARWASRATVYRHLDALAQRDLVEHVLPKTPASGKRLYHLNNLGLYLLAAHEGTSARVLARAWQADEAGLLRLLPRLPILLRVQEIVNGLVIHAADTLTTQGRRPTLVRWTWQRDLSHHFRFRDQTLRFVVDGAVSLCVETPQTDSRARVPNTAWYGLLLLCTDLTDERVMQHQLERLLVWRESPERWSVYQHVLPVLILAHSPRQCDHWQRAMAQAVQHLRVAPLAGAITRLSWLSSEEDSTRNPWHRSWRMLATGTGCHLADLLHPLPESALPPSLRAEHEQDEQQRPLSSSSGANPSLPTRLSRVLVGHFAERVHARSSDGPEEPLALPLLSLRLTLGMWQVLSLLLAHPLISTDELAALLSLHIASLRGTVSALRQWGCTASVQTRVGQRWQLREPSLRLLAAANQVSLRAIVTVVDTPAAGEVPRTFVQPGVSWLLRHSEHTAGVYGFFAQLAQAARQQPDHALCWWETGAQCERRYRVNEQWCNLRPDALADYRVGQRHIQFWLEWDRGTMNVRDLTVKFTAYAHYLASREWAREHERLPLLVCVAPDIAQEQRIWRVAQATLAKLPGQAVTLWTTTATLLTASAEGPLATIWERHPSPVDAPVAPSHVPRQSLFCLHP